MADQELRYDHLVEEALRSVVCKALEQVAASGLPGEHHFYITFQTEHPGVVMPDQLRARYPNEMTIVLQHQFWGLEVGPEAFSITLSFANVPERLTVPFAGVTAFADPSVRFGLQFDVGAGDGPQQIDEPVRLTDSPAADMDAANVKTPAEPAQKSDEAETVEDAPDPGSATVVALDSFRKK